MPQLLRNALQETLLHWQDDLPSAWKAALGDVQLDFAGVDAQLMLEAWEPIFPARKGRHLPGMPAGANMLKGFDGVTPQSVRCLVLGQDPYPSIDIATGRASEVGNVAEWRELNKMFTKSIRAWVQMLAQARTGDARYGQSFANWPYTLAAIENQSLPFENPAALCDRWMDDGVLLLNTSFTLSRFQVGIDPHQSRGHLVLWKPLIRAVLAHLLEQDEPLVCMGFGDSAAQAFAEAGLREGLHGKVACIVRDHPAYADAVLGMPNPFLLCNTYLSDMGSAPIQW